MPEEAARRAVSPFRSGVPEESTAGFLHLSAAGFGCHELLQPCSPFPCRTPRGSRQTPRLLCCLVTPAEHPGGPHPARGHRVAMEKVSVPPVTQRKRRFPELAWDAALMRRRRAGRGLAFHPPFWQELQEKTVKNPAAWAGGAQQRRRGPSSSLVPSRTPCSHHVPRQARGPSEQHPGHHSAARAAARSAS